MREIVLKGTPRSAMNLKVGFAVVADQPCIVIAGDTFACVVTQEQAEQLRNAISDVTFGWHELERSGLSLVVGGESFDGGGEQLDRVAEVAKSVSGVACDGSRAYLVGDSLRSACGVNSFEVRHDSSPSVGAQDGRDGGASHPTEGEADGTGAGGDSKGAA